MSLAPPEIAAVDALAAAGLGLTKGANLFAGPLRPGLGLACFCASTGGPIGDLMHTGQTEVQTVQVSIWSPPDAYEAGITLARAALRALHRARIGGYYFAYVREADPSPIGKDDSDRQGFSFNLELHGHRS